MPWTRQGIAAFSIGLAAFLIPYPLGALDAPGTAIYGSTAALLVVAYFVYMPRLRVVAPGRRMRLDSASYFLALAADGVRSLVAPLWMAGATNAAAYVLVVLLGFAAVYFGVRGRRFSWSWNESWNGIAALGVFMGGIVAATEALNLLVDL